jgi:hypothetical protein
MRWRHRHFVRGVQLNVVQHIGLGRLTLAGTGSAANSQVSGNEQCLRSSVTVATLILVAGSFLRSRFLQTAGTF